MGKIVDLFKALAVRSRQDGFISTSNVGFGTANDKFARMYYTENSRVNDQTLEALYASNDLAATIIDASVDKMLARDPILSASDTKQVDLLWEELRRLDTLNRLHEVLKMRNLFGGAAIFLGVDDGQPWFEPLSTAPKVRRIHFLKVLDRRELVANTYQDDVTKPGYGEPDTWRHTPLTRFQVATNAQGGERVIHTSRLLIFQGIKISDRQLEAHQGWGESILHRMLTRLTEFDVGWMATNRLLYDASQAVYKIKGLLDILAADGGDALQTRFATIEEARSTINAVLIDADGEEFTRIATSFQGLPEMLDRAMMIMASAAKMPVSVLFGRSAAGLNATGENDVRQWYDTVAMERERVVTPALAELIQLISQQAQGPIRQEIQDLEISWPSLWQSTDQELAERRKLEAETDAIYITNQVYLPEEVAIARSQGAEPADVLDLEVREQVLEQDKQELLEPTPEPSTASVVPPPLPQSSENSYNGSPQLSENSYNEDCGDVVRMDTVREAKPGCWKIYSETGDVLDGGKCFSSQKKAAARLTEIERIKHAQAEG